MKDFVAILFALTRKILTKIKARLLAFKFRWRFRIYSGSVSVDVHAIENCSIGFNVNLRGSLSCHGSQINLGDACSIASSAAVGAEKGACIIAAARVSIGPRTIISASQSRVEIGDSTSFFSDCIISGAVTIGAECLFAKNVTILSSSHQIYGGKTIRDNDKISRSRADFNTDMPVYIGDDCWLGSNCVILPGVTLGNGAVVGANAVVTKSFPAYSILAGVPAKVVGSRLDEAGKLR